MIAAICASVARKTSRPMNENPTPLRSVSKEGYLTGHGGTPSGRDDLGSNHGLLSRDSFG